MKDNSKEIQGFTKAILKNPNDEVAYLNRGLLYFDLKMYDEALTDFNKVIELNPNNAVAYNKRGRLYYNDETKGDFDKRSYQAIIDYNKAIDLDPQYADAYLNRARAYGYLPMLRDEAEMDYRKAAELSNDPNAYAHLGIDYFWYSEWDNAIECFTKVIELEPDNKMAYWYRGSSYEMIGDLEKAKVDLEKAKALPDE